MRKKRQRAYRLRQLLILLLIGLGILLALYLNDLLVRRNVTSRLDGIIDSVGGSGYPTRIPSGSIKDIKNIGKNLAVLKDSNLYIYNSKGKQTKNIQQMSDSTIIYTNAEKILYYNVGGRELFTHSGVAELSQITLDSNIINANIGISGQVGVVTSPPNYVSQITVYNDKAESIYNRTFPSEIVASLAISPKGNQIAFVVIDAKEGELDFKLVVCPITSKQELIIPIGDRVILETNFYQEDTVSVLTDQDYTVFDSHTGKLVSSYAYLENYDLIDFRKSGGSSLLLLKDRDTREYELVHINADGKMLGNKRLEIRPIDIDFGDGSVYILKGDSVEELDNSLDLITEHETPLLERIYLVDSQLFLIAKTEIDVLTEKPEEESNTEGENSK